MTYAAFLLLTFVCVAAVGDWIAVLRGNRRLEYVCKPLTIVALVAVALAVEPVDQTVRTWFVVALMLSLVGDVYLMLPRDLFVYGLSAFLCAHLAYIGGMLRHDLADGRLVAGALAAAGLLVLVGSRIILGARRRDPAMLVPVMLYMLVIGAMLAVAVGTGRVAAVIGAALFVTSDALIGWSRFVRVGAGAGAAAAAGSGASGAGPAGEPGRAEEAGRMPLAIMVTYHFGQAGLVLSLASFGTWALLAVLVAMVVVLVALLDIL